MNQDNGRGPPIPTSNLPCIWSYFEKKQFLLLPSAPSALSFHHMDWPALSWRPCSDTRLCPFPPLQTPNIRASFLLQLHTT